MDWNRCSKSEVKEFVDRMNRDTTFYDENIGYVLDPKPSNVYSIIHERLKACYLECKSNISNGTYNRYKSSEYALDLEMGRGIMVVFHDYGFSPRDASDDEIWLYINRYVIPDIVFDRFSKNNSKRRPELVPDRFYDNSRRFYPKMLWWYYYISWQDVSDDWYECLEATKEILRNNQSNDISQLIERAGTGYPIAIYKEIMAQYAEVVKNRHSADDLLSKILKLNIVHMQSIEPELMPGGISNYVSGLFSEVSGPDE